MRTDAHVDPAAALSPDMEQILSLAGRAPSIHNSQPWLWRVHGERVYLFGDPTRRLEATDPEGRNLVLSCGAALHHLQVVANALGRTARVRRMPDPGNPWHLATVTISSSPVGPGTDLTLDTVRRRRTDRRRFTSWPVPDGRLNRLAAEATLWGAHVFPVRDLGLRREILALTYEADRTQRADPAVRAEADRWRDRREEGVPSDHVPAEDSTTSEIDRLARRFPGGSLPDPALEPETTIGGLLLLCTWRDDTESRLRAGEAMSALWLRATQDRMAVLPLSQVFEVERTSLAIREGILGGLAVPHLLLRVGWPSLSADPLPPTPRRRVEELMVP
jgi:hypothetical protein